jgi:hypothetical protein
MRLLSLMLAAALIGCGSSDPERAALEAEFERSMQNVVLLGTFTVTGRGDDARLRQERYEIERVSKLAGDIWTFQARIQYGEHDVAAPIPVKLEWAGDTPIVSLTDLEIPGLGKAFTARVMFYREHYSGLWWHGEVGGQMFGRIVPNDASE